MPSTRILLMALVGVIGLLTFGLLASLVVMATLQRRRYLRTREHLGGKLLTAQDEERAAIARELHDDMVQQLIACAADLRQGLPRAAVDVAIRLDGIISNLRGLARGIHPSVVDHLTLGDALQELANTIGQREGIRVEYSREGDTSVLDATQRLALYRIAQEALGNVARHAGVDSATLTLARRGKMLSVTVADAGAGFDPIDAETGPGIGITSMRERIGILGGDLVVTGSVGKGTTITARLPVHTPE
jgi:two-component system NarL family sensor kinase